MGFLQSYSLLLLKHPNRVLSTGVVIVLILFIITLSVRPLPSFKDPLVGFEVRNTNIASRLNAWRLLQDEISASKNNLTLVPDSARYDWSHSSSYPRLEYDFSTNDNVSSVEPELPVVEMSTQNIGNNRTTDLNLIMDDGEAEYYESINSTANYKPLLIHYSLDSSRAFCGKLFEGYAQIVVVPTPNQSPYGLFNLNSMLSICQIDRRLRLEHSIEDAGIFEQDCEQYHDPKQESPLGTCCNSWSLPNYIACLNNKTTCMDIDANDIKATEQLLNLCAPYYQRTPHEECFSNTTGDRTQTSSLGPLNLLSSSDSNSIQPHCGSIPSKCLKCDGWTYNVLHFLTNDNFIRGKLPRRQNSPKPSRTYNNQEKETIVRKLSYTNIFLPIAKSSSLMKYYHTLTKYNFRTLYAQVKVMNLGLKNSLFEHLVSSDIKLLIVALVSILFVISIYTWSFILSLVLLMIICLSMCLSYTIYELILNIPIFPFMNLLAMVISFGICSDNAMLFCKHWSLQQVDQDISANQAKDTCPIEVYKEQANLNRVLRRAIVSTSVATLATACSFIISAISQVTAVRCFCIFATLLILTNYLLIVVLLPPALIIDSRLHDSLNRFLGEGGHNFVMITNYAHCFRDKLWSFGETFHKKWILHLVTKFKFYLITTFIALLVCSSILVFYSPTLQPSDDDDIKLLSKKHAFEQYDKNLRRQFAFERAKLGSQIGHNLKSFREPDTLPIRVVFGIEPFDNGNHFDPHDRGTIKFDPKFNLSDHNIQRWLLEFCHRLRQQRFIHPSSMNDMSNCFIDTFKSWMDARDCHDPIRPEIDRSPCCRAFEFPYSRYTLDKCMTEAIRIMRKTPQYNPNLNGGIRFFKNSTRVAAVIIEYQSNRLYTDSFSKMEKFFNDVDDWITWQINNTAPSGLKSGWFISSNLDPLALQLELEHGTNTSLVLEILFAMLALLISTRDVILTFAGTLTISTIILVTLTALILLKWTLGVAESILISLTIGLSIDFALHYSVAYSEDLRVRPSGTTISGILGEVGSPIALATVTTSLAGFVIFWSDILAYQELGVFLILIATISWLTSTFFLLPMLAVIDFVAKFSQQYASSIIQRALKLTINWI